MHPVLIVYGEDFAEKVEDRIWVGVAIAPQIKVLCASEWFVEPCHQESCAFEDEAICMFGLAEPVQ